MDMGMMRQRLTPCVQDGDEADLGAEPARVRGEHHHCLGGGLEQDGVDSGLVLEGDHRDLRRQREDDVEVGNRKEFSLARGEPSCTGRSLAPRTVPVAAGVVGDPRHAAVVAGLDVTAERPRPARDDCAHHAPFDTAEMAGVRLAISVAMAAQDIGNLNNGPVRTKVGADHGPRLNVPSPGRRYLKRQTIERALRRPDRMGGNLGVARRGRQIVMPKQDLDDPDIGSVLEKVRREAVA